MPNEADAKSDAVFLMFVSVRVCDAAYETAN